VGIHSSLWIGDLPPGIWRDRQFPVYPFIGNLAAPVQLPSRRDAVGDPVQHHAGSQTLWDLLPTIGGGGIGQHWLVTQGSQPKNGSTCGIPKTTQKPSSDQTLLLTRSARIAR